jgi:hypothetical protein
LLPPSKQNINVGWGFLPLDKRIFLEKSSQIIWFTNSTNTALLKAELPDSSESHEKSEVGKEWLTIYGEPGPVQDLLLNYLNYKNKKNNITEIKIVVAGELVNAFQNLGFQYIEDHPSGILLFERLV